MKQARRTNLATRSSEQKLTGRVVAAANALGDVADDETLLTETQNLMLLLGRENAAPNFNTLLSQQAQQSGFSDVVLFGQIGGVLAGLVAGDNGGEFIRREAIGDAVALGAAIRRGWSGLNLPCSEVI